MTSAILARDAAVPARDRLLDVVEMRSHLSRHLGVTSASLEIARVKYQPGVGLRIAYRAHGDVTAIVTMRSGDRRCTPPDPDAVVIPELDATFWRFPHDRRLAYVRDLMAPSGDLAGYVPNWTSSAVAGYAPGKSLVVRCLDFGQRAVAYAKLYAAGEDGRSNHELHEAIERPAAEAGLVTPRAIGFEQRRNVAFTSVVSGQRLTDVPPMSLDRTVRRFGAAVGRFHRLPVPPAVAVRTRDMGGRVSAAADVLTRVQPGLRARASWLVTRLVGEQPDAGPDVLLHGDVHFKNAIVAAGDVALIDFDQAHPGSAAADIGSLIAVLHAQAACGLLPLADAGALARAFLEGYASSAPLPALAVLRWHIAAALLAERSLRAVTRMRAAVLPHLDRLLATACDVLTEGTVLP